MDSCRPSLTPCLTITLALLLMSSAAPGTVSLNVITLQSIVIFTTHDWLPLEPTIYFHCQGENMTILPDVKETNLLYSFKGKESWQPLTVLSDKCKRCGLYERDSMQADDIFDEWELCSDDFFNGTSLHFKNNEFNATFRSTFNASVGYDNTVWRRVSVALVVVISTLVSVVVVAGTIFVYKYCKKKKRDKEQARFLQIFEEADDLEVELGLETIT